MNDVKNYKRSAKPVIVKRRQNKAVAIFIDGVGLDRAARRLRKRVDWRKLLKALSTGKRVTTARYYNLLPNSDDQRQVAFLENLSSAGFELIIKRLPPKHIERQVSINVEMASDLITFGLGNENYPDIFYHSVRSSAKKLDPEIEDDEKSTPVVTLSDEEKDVFTSREIIIVCPSKELEYPVTYINQLGVRTVTADFGKFTPNNTLTASSDWIDLTTSNDIWHESFDKSKKK